jgi:hypothetical protein
MAENRLSLVGVTKCNSFGNISMAENHLALVRATTKLTNVVAKQVLKITVFIMAICAYHCLTCNTICDILKKLLPF